MENLVINQDFWRNRIVFLTGHTGFKGGWLSLWLAQMGAKIYGYSQEPPTTPNFFSETKLQKFLTESIIGDIRDISLLKDSLKKARPSLVIHMAAQPLIHESYRFPVETFEINVMGTVNLLEAARSVDTIEAIVNITTDKCYKNNEWPWPYRENDQLGGIDPYSSSKSCAEIVTTAYRNSFLAESGIKVATARAGNVIGGGDWAMNRLIPDFLRAFDAKKPLKIRSPNAIRPWQHVLEPLLGYMKLAENLLIGNENYADAWNFGPEDCDSKSVLWIVEHLIKNIPNAKWEIDDIQQLHEATLLKIDSSKAKRDLKWQPRWPLETALEKTADWHKAWKQGRPMADFSIQQIDEYLSK